MRVKTWLISLAKLAFAAGLIYWLVHSGKISFEPFKLLAHKFWLIPFALISTLIMLLVNNYRWVLLLHGQEVLITQWDALKLSFIGLFFNLAMPGSVGGDVLKGYYITQIYPDKKVKVATSVLIDRLAGLYSIVVLAFLAVLFEWSRISNIAQLRALAIFVLILAAALSTFFAFSFSRRLRTHRYTHKTLQKIPGGTFVEKIYDALHSFRSSRKQFVLGIILSLFSQAQIFAGLYVIALQLGFSTNLESFFFVMPLGFMATAIPISPAGIGVGQAVFLALFTWYNGVESPMGPTLITVNQLCLALWGMLGAWFYFFQKGART